MKRFSLIFLSIVILVGLGVGLWWSTTRTSSSVRPDASKTEAEAAGADKPVAPPTELEGSVPGEAQAATERALAAPAAPASASGTLKGSVRLPPAIDEKGTLTVYALAERAPYRELVRLLEGEQRRSSGAKHEDDPEGKSGSAKPADTSDTGQRILARAIVANDGRFELALPEGSRRAFLALQGRFLYLERTQEVDLTRGREPLLLASVGARVKATLTLPEGSPLAVLEDLRVELNPALRGAMMMNPDRAARRRQRLDGAGVEFRAVPLAETWKLQIESDAFAFVEKPITGLRAGETRELALSLEPGGTLRGVVKKPDGQPCADARVLASSEGDWFGVDDREVRSAKSGADGSFELPHVPAGALKLRAEADNFLSSPKTDLELPAGRVTEGLVLVLREGQAVGGTLRWSDGSPAAGVEVRASFDLSQVGGMGAFNALEGAEGRSKSDAEGRFHIGGLGKGPFTLRAHAPVPGAAKDEQQSARVDGITPGTLDVALVLREGAHVRGRVVDEAAQPVAKFRVRLQHEGKGMLAALGQDSEERAIDEPAGSFDVGGLSEGNWKLWISAEHFAPSEARSLTLPLAPDAPALEIVLAKSSSVSGRVVAADGSAVSGADVRIDAGGPNWQRQMSGAPPDPETQSGEGGAFVLEGLRPGHVSLVASARDQARSLPVALELVGGAETKDVVLQLRAGGSISGEVFDESGKPVAGMLVQATELARYDQRASSSDGEGRFRFEHLEPGTYQVVAFASKALGKAGSDSGAEFLSSMKTASANVRDGEDTHVVLGAPPADPVQVVGRVVHAGQPYTGALVSFVHEGKDVLAKMKNVSVDAQGAFEVRLDEPGRYSVSVQRITGGMGQQNTVEFLREVPKEKRFEMVLEMPTGRVSGKVLDPEGNPAKGERVSMHPRAALVGGTMWGGAFIEAQTDGDGRYDIQALRPGDYVLSAGGMQMGGIFGSEAAHGREIRSDIKVSEGDWLRDVDFRLRKPGKVDVTVVGEDDHPIPKAAIFVRDAGGNLLDRFTMVATDEGGLAHYGGLAPGEYSFSSRMDVRASAEGARVKVGEGETKSVKLVLQGGTTLLVQIVDSSGQSVQAPVSVVDEAGREVAGMYGLAEIMDMFSKNGVDFGTARIGPLPPGKYKVSAQTPDGKKGSKPVTLTGQPERKLTLRVE